MNHQANFNFKSLPIYSGSGTVFSSRKLNHNQLFRNIGSWTKKRNYNINLNLIILTEIYNVLYEDYSVNDESNRQYFISENALKIDFIRHISGKWKARKYILEYYCLLAGLIEAIPLTSNTANPYGAFLKHWDKRDFKIFKIPYQRCMRRTGKVEHNLH